MSVWLAQNLIAACLLMLLVLAVRTPAARLFGAGWAYALWLLPLARLVMPPIPAGDVPALLPSFAVLVPAAGETGTLSPQAAASAPWLPLLLAVWAAGALLFIAWQWLVYRTFLGRLSLNSRSAGAHRGLPLVESAAVEGPIAVGLLDRRIVVPADFATRYSEDERRLALEHETVHHRRGDIWWNLVALFVLAANWWNPIAWISFLAFRADQELACDAAVASGASAADRHDYARALIKSASRPGLIAACPLNHADQLKRRLKMMKDHRNTRLRSLGGAVAVLILAVVGVSLGAPGLAHPHPEGETRKQHIIVMEHKGGDHAATGRAHTLQIRRGENGEVVLPEGCSGNELANVDESEGNRRTRIMVCGQEGQSAEQRLENLQRARARIAENDELSDEHRARVTAALDQAIARLRAQ